MPVGGGYLSSDGKIVTTGQSVSKLQNHLRRLSSAGTPLNLEDNERPIIKIFSRPFPDGIGYIRTLPDDISNSSWSREQIVKLPFTATVTINTRSTIQIPDADLTAYTFKVYRSKAYKPYYENQDGKRMAHLKFQYEVNNIACDQHRCQSNQKLSFRPVMARKDKGRFFLYGFTADCAADSPCQIMRADVSQESLATPPQKEPGSEPEGPGLFNPKAIAALTITFFVLVGTLYLFDD